VYDDVQSVRQIFGRVTSPNGLPLAAAIVDVFRARRLKKTVSPSESMRSTDPISSYQVNSEGQFCLADLPNGNYVLRVGTDKFAFAHSFIKVRKTPLGTGKAININLSLGN
jgi:hypothetical protein